MITKFVDGRIGMIVRFIIRNSPESHLNNTRFFAELVTESLLLCMDRSGEIVKSYEARVTASDKKIKLAEAIAMNPRSYLPSSKNHSQI